MKRLLIMFIIAFSLIFASNVNAGQLFKGFYFIGLWQGTDPYDGSEVLRSITKNRAGGFDIIGSEPYTGGCIGERGKITATGVLDDGVIVSDDFTLTCYNPAPTPGPFTASVEYVPDRFNGTLLEVYQGEAEFGPVILHRISK
jgi:hypothetical protein